MFGRVKGINCIHKKIEREFVCVCVRERETKRKRNLDKQFQDI